MAFAGLENKVALVTGAARQRSIGRATALRPAREGADVACLDIGRRYTDFPEYGLGTVDELEALVAEIRALGRRAVALQADLSTWERGAHRAVTEAHHTLGRLDVCCNVSAETQRIRLRERVDAVATNSNRSRAFAAILAA